jgi:hypothetical protein
MVVMFRANGCIPRAEYLAKVRATKGVRVHHNKEKSRRHAPAPKFSLSDTVMAAGLGEQELAAAHLFLLQSCRRAA